MKYYVAHEGESPEVEVEVDADANAPGRYHVRVGERAHVVDCHVTAPGEASLLIDGQVKTFLFHPKDGTLTANDGWFTYAMRVQDERQRMEAEIFGRADVKHAGLVRAVMPGSVVKVLVREGDEVAAGQPLVILEAMKMENEVLAEGSGTVKRILVAERDTVETDQALLEMV